MGRRKQQQPQANVGRVEDRPEEPEDKDQVHENPDFDLDEWEEQNALQARPHKRRREAQKKKGHINTSTGATATIHTLATADTQEWIFSELEIAINGEEVAILAENATALLGAQELSISQEEATLLLWPTDNAETPLGYIAMPSEELAAHLKTCLVAILALGPLSSEPSRPSNEKNHLKNEGGSSTSRASAALKSLKCPIGLRPAALQKLSAGWAEDSRRGSLPLLEILRRLIPSNGIGRSSLDPELDFPEDNEESRHRSLYSPASRAGAATWGVSSPSGAAIGDVGNTAAGATAAAAAASFDASEIYAAVKPTGQEPELNIELPQLRPTLRGYQCRAAQWMINREQSGGGERGRDGGLHPLWREVPCLPSPFSEQADQQQQLQQQPTSEGLATRRRNKKKKTAVDKNMKKSTSPPPLSPPLPLTAVPEERRTSFYVNIYTGLLSPHPFPPPPGPKGGIASDEMGLGKTVELLALIIGNPYRGPAPTFPTNITAPTDDTNNKKESLAGGKSAKKRDASGGAKSPMKSKKQHGERIDCPCGVYDSDGMDTGGYVGLWVQCSECLAWQHGPCCGFPKRAPSGNFSCQQCLRKKASVKVTQPCGTTLIICPTPILAQWKEEINRHVQPGALKVIVYEGQPQPRPGQTWSTNIITAADLAAADIVFTTYDVLKKDLYHDSDNTAAPAETDEIEETEGEAAGGGRRGGGRINTNVAGFSLRRRRRYEIIPTPLTRLRFWRVAIDEAQLVESSTAKAAAMALKLATEHRWCVTGTPLSRGLEDLQGLMAFLKVEPYADKYWWKKVIQQPYEAGSRAARARLLQLLRPADGGLLWRSAKADVKHELGIPPQNHHLTNLKFSAIERHFYARQHQECVGAASNAVGPQILSAAQAAARAMLTAANLAKRQNEGANTTEDIVIDEDITIIATPEQDHFEDRSLTQREEHKLLHPLIRLRQACVHPQVGAGGIRALSQSRTPMTMSEVLETLLAKATVEAEDAQRMVLASLNGLAGLLLLQGHVSEAVRAYREALKLVEENKIYIRADKLQQLHTLHNLAAALAGPALGDSSIARTLRDDSLVTEAAKLRDEYLNEAVTRLAAAEFELQEVRMNAAKGISEFQKLAGPKQAPALLSTWWIQAIHLLKTHATDNGAQIVNHIKVELGEADGYRRTTERNAVSIASKFRDLTGLQMILRTELEALSTAQTTALSSFQQLSSEVANPSASLVALAASCTRCRTVDPSTGTVCKHCHLDQKLVGWESRLYTLIASAMEAGGAVSVEDAALAEYNQQINRRAGRGGLGEEDNLTASGGGGGNGGSGRRSAAGISRTVLVHTASQAEKALKMLAHHLRILHVPHGPLAAQRDLLVAAAKAQLDGLDAAKKEFMKVRAVMLQQRLKLYALDELEMCIMRMQVRAPYEHLTPSEELYKIHEVEIPIKSTELSAEKAVSSAELRRCLGTLRYLQGLKAEQERVRAAAALGGGGPSRPQKLGGGSDRDPTTRRKENGTGASEEGEGDGVTLPDQPQCPICQDTLGREQCMLPCGHRLCCRCQLHLAEQIPVNQPQESKRFGCPTCRARVPLVEVAYIDTERDLEDMEDKQGRDDVVDVHNSQHGTAADAAGVAADAGGSSSRKKQPAAVLSTPAPAGNSINYSISTGEKSIRVRGSYGTKLEAVVRRLVSITQSDSTARVLVFSSWKDALELVSHALTANRLPHLYPKTAKTFNAALDEFRQGHERQLVAHAASIPSATAGGSTTGTAAATDKVSPRILLLLMKQGGNGLNLQQAQHVVFIEPILDPAEEAQAVGRVDRIGQTKATHVHRFVIQHSIEENVHRLGQHRAAAMDLAAAAVRRGKAAGDRGALTLRDVAALLQEDTGGLMGSQELAAWNNN